MLSVLSLIIIIILIAVRLVYINTIPPKYNNNATPSNYGINYTDVEFNTEDGIRLKGWLLPGESNKPVIVLLHGWDTSKAAMLPHAVYLHRNGYNVFMIDFRAHGESEGKFMSFGYEEQRDLKAALNFLNTNSTLKNNKIIVLGISMGASVGIMVAAKDKRIEAVIADSPYISLNSNIIKQVNLKYNLPSIPFGYIAIASYAIRFMVNPWYISPIKVIDQIAPRPVFIIGTLQDTTMLPKETELLYTRAKKPKEIWFVPNARHGEALKVAPDIYAKKVINFLEDLSNR
jgi:pimeloyl-ACP methyl ester carboxylesterase